MTMDGAASREAVIEILGRLVAFDTESSRSNLALIDYIEAYLRDLGVASVRLPSQKGDKAALFATIGPTDRGGVCLSGHTDVVPVAGQSWTTDPFRLRVADGRAYGRGAVDMKGFCAIALAHVPVFQSAALRTPVHLVFSYDEETTCLGVKGPIARMGQDFPLPRAVIVGEPTAMQAADAHKSVVTFNTDVHGTEAHSSKLELGASAITGAVMLMAELDRIGEEMIARGDPTGRFDPPYSSVHIGVVHGGTARNIMAKLCSFHWEFRGLPGLDPGEIPARFERYAREVVVPRLTAHGKAASV
jgi:acetylornithine deacetylase